MTTRLKEWTLAARFLGGKQDELGSYSLRLREMNQITRRTQAFRRAQVGGSKIPKTKRKKRQGSRKAANRNRQKIPLHRSWVEKHHINAEDQKQTIHRLWFTFSVPRFSFYFLPILDLANGDRFTFTQPPTQSPRVAFPKVWQSAPN